MVSMGAWRICCKSEEFGRMNVIRVLSEERIMCVKYMT